MELVYIVCKIMGCGWTEHFRDIIRTFTQIVVEFPELCIKHS